MPEERLQKLLAAAGVGSRRAAEELIRAGRVTVDGQVASLGRRADPAVAEIRVDGRLLGAEAPRVHLALHKPMGVTSTVRDAHAERTVLELVGAPMRDRAGRLYPVGRLDRDSEGLLLLTNDGPWAERVLHPRHQVPRTYLAGVASPLTPSQVDTLRDGIVLEEGTALVRALSRASRAELGSVVPLLGVRPPDLTWYRVVLGQGWRRQLRRMFAAVGVPIVRLVRVAVGDLRLDGLASGAWRELRADEVEALAGHPRRVATGTRAGHHGGRDRAPAGGSTAEPGGPVRRGGSPDPGPGRDGRALSSAGSQPVAGTTGEPGRGEAMAARRKRSGRPANR